MYHQASIKLSGTGKPEAMIIYGGINCYQRVTIGSTEKSVAFYTWSNQAIEYVFAMEDIWFFNFDSLVWLEMKTMRTKRRGVCPPAENVAAIKGADEKHWSARRMLELERWSHRRGKPSIPASVPEQAGIASQTKHPPLLLGGIITIVAMLTAG